MKISVALATFNGALYLQAQLDSLVKQTRLPHELVVSDDSSADHTWKILEAFQRTAPFTVKLFKNRERKGYVENFGFLISEVTGSVVLFCDQDDIWLPRKIETVVSIFDANPRVNLVVHDAEIVHADLSKTGLTLSRQLRRLGCNTDELLFGCCMAYRSVVTPLLLPIPAKHHGHDGWLNSLMLALDCRFFLPTPLVLYRRHSGNTSSQLFTESRAVNQFHSFLSKVSNAVRHNHAREASKYRLIRIKLLIDRLEKNKDYISRVLHCGPQLEYVIVQLTEDAALSQARYELQKLPFIRRLFRAIQFYRQGRYRSFNGLFSLLRDIVC